MGYANDTGYTPATFEDIMSAIRVGINAQFGTSYTVETFVGTGYYKYMYAPVQRLLENEVKTSEIFLKLQGYFAAINARISRPVNTNPGLIERIGLEGYPVSVKPPTNVDAGKLFICVDVDETADDYAAQKLLINTVIKDSTVAGVVTQGAQVNTIVLTNGQAFDFKFALPDRVEPLIRLTTVLSENNQVVVGSPDDVRIKLFANIMTRYSLGKNFEPERYFSLVDAPWAESVLLEYSTDGGATWSNDTFEANYDDLFVVKLENIEIVEA